MDVKTHPLAVGKDGKTGLMPGQVSGQVTSQVTPDSEPTGPLGITPPPGRFALSPLNKRRWQNFKTNRRGYWSLWIFLVLFFVTLFAEFIANDKPLYISFSGKSYFPVVFTYPETTFGGDFEIGRAHV